jgi:hypothetical protein
MKLTFKQFLNINNFYCSIFEQENAPSIGGAPPSPENPNSNNTTNKHHFDVIKKEFGIEDSEMNSALEGGSIPVFKVPDYSKQWGYLVSGPSFATVVARPDGNYEVTFQLSQKKLLNPNSFILPYKKGETPTKYNGEVKDEVVIMTSEEFQDMMALPYSKPSGQANNQTPGLFI